MAQVTLPIIPDSKDYHFVDGMATSGLGDNPELSIMEQLLAHVHREDEIFRDNLSGWFIGSNEEEDKVRKNITANGDSVKIDPHDKDETIVLGLKLPEEATSFTLSFSFDTKSSNKDKIGWTVWDYHLDETEPYEKVGAVHNHDSENNASDSPITLTFYGENGGNLTGDYVFIMWNTTPSEDYLQINEIMASYKNTEGTVVTYRLVPEPTTTTFSLLALAGLAARRRRK